MWASCPVRFRIAENRIMSGRQPIGPHTIKGMNMAAGGTGTFDNDDALEWIGGFGADGANVIVEAFDNINELDPTDYIEAEPAAHALAAAELVAAARDGDTDRLPDDAVASLQENAAKINAAKLLPAARKAVARILKQSELKEQWEDSPDAEDWEDGVRELLERLKG